MAFPQISGKMHKVLRVILVAFLAIVLRVWHLGVVQREEKLLEAQKPQQRTVLLRADRGTLCDRFHVPLALNRICYNAAIYYGQIAQIPTVSWKSGPDGKRVRIYERKEYIRELSQALAKTLELEPSRVEDLIHSKASLFPHVPFIIKGGISEEEHYRLRMLERNWLGVHAEIAAERYYPLGKTASSLIGTMGAISHKEYSDIAQEIALLQEAVDQYENGEGIVVPRGHDSFDSVYRRLGELKEKSYAINDLVGKTGIESQFEEELRGFFGKKSFEVDQKGKFLRELLGNKEAIPGRQVVLTISAELQQFAEALLAQDEKVRDGRSIGVDPTDKLRKTQKQPWIKGGAIAVLDPNTGEILALASHPRFEPNDFISTSNPRLKTDKQKKVCRWLENERFIGSVWDGKDLLVRERITGSSRRFFEEAKELTWDFYLDLILPAEGPLRLFFNRVSDLKSAIQLQEDFEEILYFSRSSDPYALLDALFPSESSLSGKSTAVRRAAIHQALQESASESAVAQKRLESILSPILANTDKLFAIDLCRMAVYSPAFTDSLIAQTGHLKINSYRSLCQAFQRLESEVRQLSQKKFHEEQFPLWREENQKKFIAEKRKREKEQKTYARPYVDYLDEKERELFSAFWEEARISLLLAEIQKGQSADDPMVGTLRDFCSRLESPLAEEFLRTFRSFSALNRPLLGQYKRMRNQKDQTEKDLAAAFYPIGGFGFSRSYAFQAGAPQGSIFKLVTAYEALRQEINLSLIDEMGYDPKAPKGRGQIVAYALNRAPYPRFYKGGRLPRTSNPQVGQIDLLGALEQSSNSYFAILAGDYFKDSEDLLRAASRFGFGSKTGIELPGESKGNLPTDLKTNRTGLYSSAIGQHTLLTTPLQTACMIGALANGGHLLKPKIIKEVVGLAPDQEPLGSFASSTYFAKEELEAIGISFPLFTSVQPAAPLVASIQSSTEIRQVLPFSPSIRSQLFEGMDRVVWSPKGGARPAIIKGLRNNPALMRDYLSLQHQMIGKTGTAEILYNPNLNPSSPPQVYKYIWFGAISFTPDPLQPTGARWDRPELVVVVFLRYGDAGKEAAPLAAQIIHKWREIKKKHEN